MMYIHTGSDSDIPPDNPMMQEVLDMLKSMGAVKGEKYAKCVELIFSTSNLFGMWRAFTCSEVPEALIAANEFATGVQLTLLSKALFRLSGIELTPEKVDEIDKDLMMLYNKQLEYQTKKQAPDSPEF